MNKQQLRDSLRRQRASFSTMYQQQAAQELVEMIKPLISPKITKLAIYQSLTYELNLHAVIDYAMQLGIKLYKPIAYAHSQIMQLDAYSVNQPSKIFYPKDFKLEDPANWDEMDLILIPVVAVDIQGYRLGNGYGYYDKTLANHQQPNLCGIGFEEQIVDNVYKQTWDIRLNYFATNKRLIHFNLETAVK